MSPVLTPWAMSRLPRERRTRSCGELAGQRMRGDVDLGPTAWGQGFWAIRVPLCRTALRSGRKFGLTRGGGDTMRCRDTWWVAGGSEGCSSLGESGATHTPSIGIKTPRTLLGNELELCLNHAHIMANRCDIVLSWANTCLVQWVVRVTRQDDADDVDDPSFPRASAARCG